MEAFQDFVAIDQKPVCRGILWLFSTHKLLHSLAFERNVNEVLEPFRDAEDAGVALLHPQLHSLSLAHSSRTLWRLSRSLCG